MRNILLTVMLVLFLGCVVWAESTSLEVEEVAVTATAATTSLSHTSRAILFINDGANEVFIAPKSTVATASADACFELKAGESVEFDDYRADSVSMICSTAETSTVRLLITY
jgi:hypothetical protein